MSRLNKREREREEKKRNGEREREESKVDSPKYFKISISNIISPPTTTTNHYTIQRHLLCLLFAEEKKPLNKFNKNSAKFILKKFPKFPFK